MREINMHKKIQNKFLSILLVLSMLIATPLTSLAGLNDNTSSGGGEEVGIDPDYAHKFFAYPENQGYRLSIVNKDGIRVTNSVDIVNYIPTEVYDISDDNSINGSGDYTEGYNRFINYLGWNDLSGTYENKKERNKNNLFRYSNGIKTEPYSDISWKYTGIPYGLNEKNQKIETFMYPKSYMEMILIYEYNTQANKILKDESISDDIKAKIKRVQTSEEPDGEIPYNAVKLPLPSTLEAGGFKNGGEKLLQIMKSKIGLLGLSAEEQKDIAIEENVISVLVNMELRTFDNKGKITEKEDYLFKFADPVEQARVGTIETNIETGEPKQISISHIVTEKEYKVIIEPLYWFVPEICSYSPEMVKYGERGLTMTSVPYVTYGTVSYLSKFMYDWAKARLYDDGKGNIMFGIHDDIELRTFWAGPNWATSNLGVTTLMVAFDDTELGIKEPSGNEIPITTIAEQTGMEPMTVYDLYELAAKDYYKTTGYAVHIYDKLLMSTFEDTGTPTWDDENYPEDKYQPAPAPSGKNFPTEEEYVESKKDHEFNIVKFYGQKQSDGSYKYTDNKTRTNTIHTVTMNDEPGYVVDNYFSSSKFKEPSSKSTSYDEYKNTLPKGSLSGDSAGTVVIGPEEEDTTLYVRLTEKPEIQIVKYFPDISPKIEITDKKTSYDAKEDGYTYKEDKQTPNKVNPTPDSWDDTPSGDLGTNEKIPIKEDTKTIFIRYDNGSGAATILTLHQNELAKTFTLESLNSLVTLTHNFQNKEKSGRGDHGYWHDDDDGDSHWHSDWRTWYRQISDDSYGYVMSNHNNYGSTTFIGSQGAFTSQELGTIADSGTLGMSGGNTNGLTPNLKFSIYRDSAKDNVTLYPNKNSSVKGELAQIGSKRKIICVYF